MCGGGCGDWRRKPSTSTLTSDFSLLDPHCAETDPPRKPQSLFVEKYRPARVSLLNTLNCHNFFNLRRVVRASVKKWSRVRRSVRLSVPSVDSSSGGRRRFAAELGRGQQIDSCCCGGTCGPRKCWSDGKEVGHVSARYWRSGHVTSRCALRSVT